jgi:hypothetical protein
MEMQMFTTFKKEKPDTENITGLNLVVVKHTTIQVTRRPLQHEVHELGHDLLCHALTDRGLVYIVACVLKTWIV